MAATILLQPPADGDRGKFVEWLFAISQKEPLRPTDVIYDIVIAEPVQLSASELRSLEASIAGRPDHPSREQLKTEQRRAIHGPDATGMTVFWSREGAWRSNVLREWVDPKIRFLDTCVRPDRAWRLTPEQLAIVDPASGYPPGRDYASNEATILHDIDGMLDGSMSRRLRGMTIEQTSLRENTWTARASRDGRIFEYSGTVTSGSNGSPLFEPQLWRIAAHPDKTFVGQSERYEQWEFNEATGRRLAHRVVFVRADGAVERTSTLSGVRRMTQAEFDQLTAIPEIGVPDPVRGEVRIAKVFDLRPNVHAIKFPLEPNREPMPLPGQGQRVNNLQTVGIVLACLIVAVLVWLRVRRK
ncbi:MAG: hypothetical protein IT435_06440 [Phycisphaerales bacterium]|nr:hypothetical protein [Phycisphaerales bacterium]